MTRGRKYNSRSAPAQAVKSVFTRPSIVSHLRCRPRLDKLASTFSLFRFLREQEQPRDRQHYLLDKRWTWVLIFVGTVYGARTLQSEHTPQHHIQPVLRKCEPSMFQLGLLTGRTRQITPRSPAASPPTPTSQSQCPTTVHPTHAEDALAFLEFLLTWEGQIDRGCTMAELMGGEERVREIWDGLERLQQANEQTRERVRTLRSNLSARRRTLAIATSTFLHSHGSTATLVDLQLPHADTQFPAVIPNTHILSANHLYWTIYFSADTAPARDVSGRCRIAFLLCSGPGVSPLPGDRGSDSFARQIDNVAYQLAALSDTIAHARSELVQELVEVFSVVEVGGRPPLGGKAGTKGEWTIGGLVLPIPGDICRYPPDHINAVIIHTLHFLSLLSFYLGIKLLFEVVWAGSRSAMDRGDDERGRWRMGQVRLMPSWLATTMELAKRLGSETEAKSWLDGVVASYAQRSGISLSAGGARGASGGASGGPTINSEEFLKFKADQDQFAAQQIELYMRYLGRNSKAGEIKHDAEKANVAAFQVKLDAISKEHGDTYVNGIQPVFDVLKARHFDSSWNWVRQDALLMFYDIIFGRLNTINHDMTARCIAIMNHVDPELVTYMQSYINRCDPNRGKTYRLAKQFGQQLIENCREVIGQPPLYKDVTFPTAPHTEVTAKGNIVYSEVVRENVHKLEAYIQEDVLKLWNIVKTQPEISEEQKNRIKALYGGVIQSLHKCPEFHPRHSGPRKRRSSSQFLRPQISGVTTSITADKVPLLHLKRKVGTNWECSSNLTSVYLDILHEIATSGTTFKDKNALCTGVGKGSIGVEIVKGLLSGGAYVPCNCRILPGIFQQFGSKGSALTVVPFNQGSKQDVEALIDYVYSTLGLDLDYILPFAAVPENGCEIDGIDDKSELAHRIMLVNLLRLLGAVKNKKASRQFVTRPTQVILPLSPNHGLFGNDRLYSESKISLETLFNRWNSESWGEYLCLAGAVIRWTRGTSLMDATNMVTHEVEGYGVRTFSAKEMAFNILGLMHPLLFSITQVEPIWANLNRGMDHLPDLAEITTRIRTSLNKKSELRRAIARDNAADFKVVNGIEAEHVLQTVDVTPHANLRFEYPQLESVESLADVSKLRGMIDLEKVIVITGFAEVGPWGSSRTRWEMEARGEFTLHRSHHLHRSSPWMHRVPKIKLACSSTPATVPLIPYPSGFVPGPSFIPPAQPLYDLAKRVDPHSGLPVPVACLNFGPANALGSVKIHNGEHVLMGQYLTKLSSLGSSKNRRFVASDGQGYHWAHQAGQDDKWVCQNASNYHIMSYTLKAAGEPKYTGSSGCALTIEEDYAYLTPGSSCAHLWDTKILAKEPAMYNGSNPFGVDEKGQSKLDDLPFYCIGFKSAALEFTLCTCIWASLRTQMLYRTVSDMMNYMKAISTHCPII
ncbi:hypothetical protein CERSUDRAFT_122278 [Gelatoporia subvermispora B]|uniref:Autophagy-related protein 14 n=1 Tax=Ceriporiopsis subvermispora (strain B) TaxID=914234 RepID=M2QT50_CERS8|nr:hypothetical protein CERSUDRAFT_122278 [Gelatoporia subvermispora B]